MQRDAINYILMEHIPSQQIDTMMVSVTLHGCIYCYTMTRPIERCIVSQSRIRQAALGKFRSRTTLKQIVYF